MTNEAQSFVEVDETAVTETQEQRRERLAWEAGRIGEGLESIRLGRTVSFQAFSEWVDSIGTPNELPPPQSGLS